MNEDFIMQMRPWFGQEEKNALADYMEEDGFLTEFKHTEEFEEKIAEYTGANHCILVNNGTISLTLSAIAVGIERGDEVIVPNYTMIASANALLMIGANPIFVDVERETLCLDIAKTKDAISSKTKAIMLVSANGRYPKSTIEEFQKLCVEKSLILIEDAAQSLGSLYPDGVHIGRKGKVGSFSFSAPKIITTGQGGAIITDDEDVASKIRKLKDFGRTSGGNDTHDSIGYNFKFTELQSVVGLEQMKKLPFRVERKKEIYRRYKKNLEKIPEIEFFEHDFKYTSPWFIDCIVEDRDGLQKSLKEAGIGSRAMYPPLNSQKAYQRPGDFPIAKFIGEKGLWLPSMSQLRDQDIDRICLEINKHFIK